MQQQPPKRKGHLTVVTKWAEGIPKLYYKTLLISLHSHWNNQWTLIFTSQTGGQIPPGCICSKWEDTQWQRTNIANLLASILLWDVTQFKAFVKAITAILCTKCKIHEFKVSLALELGVGILDVKCPSKPLGGAHSCSFITGLLWKKSSSRPATERPQ